LKLNLTPTDARAFCQRFRADAATAGRTIITFSSAINLDERRPSGTGRHLGRR
jgi:hypothetical protein